MLTLVFRLRVIDGDGVVGHLKFKHRAQRVLLQNKGTPLQREAISKG